MKTINKYIAIVLVGSSIFTACQSEKVVEEEHEEETVANQVEITSSQYEHVGIQMGAFENKNLKNVIKANGHLEVPPQYQASVSSFMGGVVKSIHVIESDFVEKGAVLATLEHQDFLKLQEEYLKTKGNLVFVEQEYARQKELYEENVSSGKVFQQTQANYNAEKAKFSSLQNQLRLLHISTDELENGQIKNAISILAPISGYVGHVRIRIGEYVEPSKQLFEIIDNRHIHVDLLVYEKDLFKVKIGQKVSFIMTNQSSEQIEGEVFGVAKAFENETKSLAVHAEIKNNEKLGLVQGMYVNALIAVGEQTVKAIPVDAVVLSGGSEYIFIQVEGEEDGNENNDEDEKEQVEEDNKEDETSMEESEENEEELTFRMVEVKTGISELGYIEVVPIEDLENDSKVVVKGAFYLLSQLKNAEGGDDDD
jgi:cobalt-zinc-cadmium efflux system membrane fusion protein